MCDETHATNKGAMSRQKSSAHLRNVEVVVLVLWEVFKELYKKVVVVKCSLVVICVVVHIRVIRVGEPHTHWGLHWNERRYSLQLPVLV